MKLYYITYETLTALCDAVRKITGKRRTLLPRELASLIRGAKRIDVPDDEVVIDGLNITITNYVRPMIIKEYYLDNSFINIFPTIDTNNIMEITLEDIDETMRSPIVRIKLDNSNLEDIQSFESYATFSNGYTDTIEQMSIKKFSMNNTKISDNIEVG